MLYVYSGEQLFPATNYLYFYWLLYRLASSTILLMLLQDIHVNQ